MSDIGNQFFKKEKFKQRLLLILGAIGVLMFVGAIIYNYSVGQELEQELTAATSTAEKRQADQDAAIANLATALENQTQQFEDCKEHTSEAPIPGCEEPISESPDKIVEDTQDAPVPVIQGPRGAQGPGPTQAQVLAGFDVWCAPFELCQGPQGTSGLNGQDGKNGNDGLNGKDGANGQNATQEQINAAVAAYCEANNKCAGPAGKDGTNGTNGTNGTDGANATPEQIEAAVAAYCSENACAQGPPGPEGPMGPEGPTGLTGPAGTCNPIQIRTFPIGELVTVCAP